MRVLHMAAGNLYGGVETLLVTLARERHLVPEMKPAYSLCFPGRLQQELEESRVPVFDLGPVRLSRPWTLWRARRRLDRLLGQERYDVVITHGSWAHVVASPVAAGRGIKLAYWAHGPATPPNWLDRWARRTRPGLVLANSRFTQAGVTQLFGNVPVEMCHYPVRPPDLAAREEVRREVRVRWQTAESAVVILQVSRLEPWKGQECLLAAAQRLPRDRDWVCWIAGGAQRPEEAAYMACLERQVQERGLTGRVRFLGQRSDVPELLAAADVFCQPNIGPESFGIVFVEGLYAGLPVVATALGGALEIIREDCGVLVAPDDSAALAEALSRLIGDPDLRARLGHRGPARADELCNPARQMARLAELLGKLVDGKAGGTSKSDLPSPLAYNSPAG